MWRELHARGDRNGRDRPADDAELANVAAFARQIGMQYPIAMGGAAELAAYRVQLLPTTYVINAEGVITHTVVGEVSASELREAVEEARAQ